MPMINTVRTRVALQNGVVVAVGAPGVREVNVEAVVTRDGIHMPGMRAVVGVCVRSVSIGTGSICGLQLNGKRRLGVNHLLDFSGYVMLDHSFYLLINAFCQHYCFSLEGNS